VKEIVDSGELGAITKIEASLAVSHLFVKDGDIRLVYDLGGGAMMDMGCEFDIVVSRFLTVHSLAGYTLSMLRYITGADPTKIISAKADMDPKYPQIDTGTTATLSFPSPGGSTEPADGLTGTLYAHFRLPPVLGFLPQWSKVFVRVTGTRGTVELNNFPCPWLYHSITIESSEHEGGRMRKRTEKQYGNLGWTTQVSSCFRHLLFDVNGYVCRYRYQLEAFIDKLRGRNPEHWYDAQDSITNMQWIEAIYKEVGHHIVIHPRPILFGIFAT